MSARRSDRALRTDWCGDELIRLATRRYTLTHTHTLNKTLFQEHATVLVLCISDGTNCLIQPFGSLTALWEHMHSLVHWITLLCL